MITTRTAYLGNIKTSPRGRLITWVRFYDVSETLENVWSNFDQAVKNEYERGELLKVVGGKSALREMIDELGKIVKREESGDQVKERLTVLFSIRQAFIGGDEETRNLMNDFDQLHSIAYHRNFRQI